MLFEALDFYPTPVGLLEKITKDVDWRKVATVLEPSAGKGDIVAFAKEKFKAATWGITLDLDCIELNPDLRSTLKGKEYRVVHDDFLTYNTFKKYDLILMNPPFSQGCAHLTKALDMQKNGGAVICILNAETLKNPYSNERKALLKRLEDLGATIEFMENEFVSAERTTSVEIAVVKVCIEAPELSSRIYEEMKAKAYAENTYESMTEVAPSDYIEAIVQMYNVEVAAGVALIMEYKAMCPHILCNFNEQCKAPLLTLKLEDDVLSTNAYVKAVRRKYWEALFKNPRFTANMTSNLRDSYAKQVDKLIEYDFSVFNIKTLQEEMCKNLVHGIEDCIIQLFDKLSHQYAYSDELQNNIHYFNGWKTNKAWYINRKVIIPYMRAWGMWGDYRPTDYDLLSRLSDIEKALNYLDGGLTDDVDLRETLRLAGETGQTKKIRLKYFTVTFFKKGTCHIEFLDEELLKKFNIFGSQQKGWLPPGYGKKQYAEMTPEEKAVVDEFEGEKEYNKIMANRGYYIYDSRNQLKMLEVG